MPVYRRNVATAFLVLVIYGNSLLCKYPTFLRQLQKSLSKMMYAIDQAESPWSSFAQSEICGI